MQREGSYHLGPMTSELKPTRSFCSLSDFSSKLLSWALTHTRGNVCLSPFGVTIALTMAMTAADEKTTAQVVSALGAVDDNSLFSSCEAISTLLNSAEADTKVYFGSKIFLANSVPVQSDFNETMSEMFSSEVGVLDFQKGLSTAMDQMNAWACKETEGQLSELVKWGDVNEKSRMILASVIYFRGRWSEEFFKTSSQPFHVSLGNSVNVEMMESCREANYCHSTQFACQALELPYICRELNLLILLPNAGNTLEKLASCVAREQLNQLLAELKPTPEISVTIPKFRVQKTYQLQGALRALGMDRLFDPKLADLSRMTSTPGLCLDEVIHEALFELAGEGRPAATKSGAQRAGPVFRADRPFLFVLLQHCHQAVVFVGGIQKP